MAPDPAGTLGAAPLAPDRTRRETIASRFEAIVASQPDRPALLGPEERLSFAELNRRANQVARSAAGAVGETTMLLAGPSLDAVIGLLALAKAGRICLPTDPGQPVVRLREIVETFEVTSILTTESHRALAEAAIGDRGPVATVEFGVAGPGANLDLPLAPDDVALIALTSGSTGRPKGVLRGQAATVASLLARSAAVGLEPLDCQSLLRPLSFSSSVNDAFSALFCGASVFAFDLAQHGLRGLEQQLARQPVTVLSCSPGLLRELTLRAADRSSLAGLRRIKVGAEPLNWSDVERFREWVPNAALVHSYGVTEVWSLTSLTIDPSTPLGVGRVPVGYALPDRKVWVLDEAGQPVAPGQIGEVVVESRNLSLGYWRDPTQTARRFGPGREDPGARTFRTGDFGSLNPDGCLSLVGRRDDVVQLFGRSVALGEVEAKLAALPGVREAAVLLREDVPDAPRLVGYVVPTADQDLSPTALRRTLRTMLPGHMVPTAFVTLPTLPRLSGGKLDRRALPAPDRAGEDRRLPVGAAPRGPVEEQLAALWRSLLGLAQVGRDDNLFDLGADSLTAIQLVTEIDRRFGRTLTAADLARRATIAELAAWIAREAPADPASPCVPLQPTGTREPLFLVYGLGGGVMDYAPLARLLGDDQPVIGLQALPGDEAPDTLVEMAARCVGHISAFYPTGRVHLGGYSFGAILAYEVGRQLRAEGREVGLLAVIDAGCPTVRGRPVPLTARGLRRMLGNLPRWAVGFLQLGPRGMAARARRKLSSLRRWDSSSKEDLEALLDSAIDGAWLYPPAVRRAMALHLRASRAFKPAPYPGRLTLIQARTRPLFERNEPGSGWLDLAAAGVELLSTPGTHAQLLRPPWVAGLARQLRSILAAAQRPEHHGA
jgi:amino acid adenylation domain-containing protein